MERWLDGEMDRWCQLWRVNRCTFPSRKNNPSSFEIVIALVLLEDLLAVCQTAFATIRQADLERCVFVLYVFIERRRVCRETGSRRTGEGISRIAD